MIPDRVSFITYPNLFGIKGFVVVVVDILLVAIIVVHLLNSPGSVQQSY
jgi:hypothetical protein